MKELVLENGKARIIKTKHETEVKIGRRNDNYYIIQNSKSRGPFEKILLDKTENDNFIIGYTKEESRFYIIDTEGLKLVKKEKINLENTKKEEVDLDNCVLIGKIHDYSIFIDNNTGKLFVVNTKESIKPLDEYPKFDNYDDLVNCYRQNFNISLFSIEMRSLVSKQAHLLINFKDLYSSTIQLTLEQLPEEILFDILTDRAATKKIFDVQKKQFFTNVYGEEKTNELIKQGYTQLTASTYENILKKHPSEMNPYYNLLQNKIAELKKNCSNYIKQTDNINLYRLECLLGKLSIKDLPYHSLREITANRPLTKGIFLSMLCACFDKLEEEGTTIKHGYRKSNNFQVTYPTEYSTLWEIASKKLPELSDEYFEERKKTFLK